MSQINSPSTEGLLSLPDELLLQILDQIAHVDFATWRVLTMTSRTLHRLAIARLYACFEGRRPDLYIRTVGEGDFDSNHCLANYTKEVVWPANKPSAPLELSQLALTSGGLSRVKKMLPNPSVRPQIPFVDIIDVLSAESKDSYWHYLEFFLCYTPNIEKLIIHGTHLWNSFERWLENVAANPNSFCHLTSVILFGPLMIENIVSLLLLPSIRRLELVRATSVRWPADRADESTDRLDITSPLEHLVIRQAGHCQRLSQEIIRALRNLKTIDYEWAVQEPIEGSINHAVLVTQCLRFSVRIRAHIRTWFIGIFTQSTPIVTMPRLRTLDVGPFEFSPDDDELWENWHDGNMVYLRFIAGLPPTLETLRILLRYGEQPIKWSVYARFLRALARIALKRGTALKHVAVVDWPTGDRWTPPSTEVADLQEYYKGLGVGFSLHFQERECGIV